MLQVDLFLSDLFNNKNKQTVLLLQEKRKTRKICIMRIVKIAEHTLLCVILALAVHGMQQHMHSNI